jgi:Protein of unknown function (DUF3572)
MGFQAGKKVTNSMPRDRRQMTLETAENIAAQGLAFLAEEPARLSHFLTLTGLRPDEVRAQAETPEFLAAVLEHIVNDESLLLVFAANASIAPEMIGPALTHLRGRTRTG